MKFSGGLPETVCGTGSTLRATVEIRSALPALLSKLDVKILLDAPCGDLNWISAVNLDGISYIGADIDEDYLRLARLRNKTAVLRRMDIVNDALPPVDAMLCRDFHQHFPEVMVLASLRNFARSDIQWMLATRHVGATNVDIACPGQFRPIDLAAWIGEPIMEIPDAGRMFAVWHHDSFASLR